MGWISDFIQCIVKIFTFILGLWIPDGGVVVSENVKEFSCAEARWHGSPNYERGYFDGDVEVVCKFQISEEGNLIQLRQLLQDGIIENSLAVHGETVMNVRGMPGIRYDHTMDISELNRTNEVRGYTHIATDGFTKLSSIFKAVPRQTGRAISGAENISIEAHVLKVSNENEYTLRMRNHVYMSRPWLVSPSRFVSEVMIQSEEELEVKAVDLVQWIASSI